MPLPTSFCRRFFLHPESKAAEKNFAANFRINCLKLCRNHQLFRCRFLLGITDPLIPPLLLHFFSFPLAPCWLVPTSTAELMPLIRPGIGSSLTSWLPLARSLSSRLTVFEALVSEVAEAHQENAKAQHGTPEYNEPDEAGGKQAVHPTPRSRVYSHRLAVDCMFARRAGDDAQVIRGARFKARQHDPSTSSVFSTCLFPGSTAQLLVLHVENLRVANTASCMRKEGDVERGASDAVHLKLGL